MLPRFIKAFIFSLVEKTYSNQIQWKESNTFPYDFELKSLSITLSKKMSECGYESSHLIHRLDNETQRFVSFTLSEFEQENHLITQLWCAVNSQFLEITIRKQFSKNHQ